MVSFIIISSNKEKRVDYASNFCFKKGIGRFDITIIEKDTSAKDAKQSIGIDDVKQMQKKISLKPIKSPFKAVIIEDAHLLTTEAQNALLKVLEEPPANTILILGANSKEALLPTIRSRCQIVELEEEQEKITDKDRESITEFITALPTMTIGERLKKAEALAKDKDKALLWLEKLLFVLRDQTVNEVMAKSEATQQSLINIFFLQSFQKLHTTLKTTNVNPRFALENTLLNLTL